MGKYSKNKQSIIMKIDSIQKVVYNKLKNFNKK